VRAIVVHQWAVSGGCRLSGSMIMWNGARSLDAAPAPPS
jgi:hypothetical protein